MKQEDRIPVTAVFDIGKTNKKFLLFDEQFQIVFKHQTSLDQTVDDDGDPCEDLEQLVRWMRGMFEEALTKENIRIKTLNFSTYGATLVHLDEQGEPATPVYNYLKEYPEDLLQEFYDRYGGREQFSLETASPPMGMLNSGLQLFWLKHGKPDLFKRIRHTLHLPQYLSYLFTGRIHAELTSIGCHTGLWDFRKNTYHRWLDEEGMKELLPAVQSVGNSYETDGKRANIQTGLGIHDSSAALAPYLAALDDPFLLLSTGTWSISFNPFNAEPLTFEELQRDCLCYLNIYGEQVKASRLFLGREYMHQKQKLESHFGHEPSAPPPELDAGLLKRLIKEENPLKKLKLGQAHSSGPYPQMKPEAWEPEVFDSYREAYHQLMLDLVSIQADCIELVEGKQEIEKLIVTGGFSQNDFFVKMLASRFPGKKVYTTALPHATALGAALVINDNERFENGKQNELLNLALQRPLADTGIERYSWYNTKSHPADRNERQAGI